MSTQVTYCWCCCKRLVAIKGGFSFAIILDPDGHELRVHHACVKSSVGDGYRLKPKEAKSCSRD